MFLQDCPIESCDDDCFGRREFAEHLAHYLCSMTKESSYVIALQGKWGSGKTSLINMTVSKLRECTKKPIIVYFNPWTCASTDKLVIDFLHALRNGLSSSLTTEAARNTADKALRAIERYAAVLAPVDVALTLSGTPLSTKKLVERAAKSLSSFTMGGDDIDTCKKHVSNELKYAFENVIVVIDDIDRLPNNRICLLFQLVAQIADFPHVHYLLAYDVDVVERAIHELQNAPGWDYLEKIVQLPIDIPQIPRAYLYERIRGYLNPILVRNGISEEDPEASRASRVIGYALAPSIHTMRDFKRFLNAFEFELSYCEGDISVVDLIALVTLKQFYPGVIEWVDAHVSQLCGPSENTYAPAEAAKRKEEKIEELSRVCGSPEKADLVVETFMAIYPRFECLCGSFSEILTLQDLKMAGRVACEEAYKRYRSASLGTWGYPRDAIKKLLNQADRNEIADVLENGLANGFDFAEEASGLTGGVTAERAREIAGGILDSIKRSHATDGYESWGDPLEGMLRDLLTECGMDDASSLLNDMVSQSTLEGLVRVSHLINSEELAHGRLASSGKMPHRQLLSPEGLSALEKAFTHRVKEVSNERNMLSLQGVRMLLYLWDCFDEESERIYIAQQLAEDERNLAYLCRLCVGVWRTAGPANASVITGWLPNRKEFERYLAFDSACESIARIHTNPRFWELDESTLQATAATYLISLQGIPEGDESTMPEISHEEVLEQLERWRQECSASTR